ncbi:hypothetical protein [Pararhodobacter oceanensis]|uniref:hypothetical protein n=1 Tax=Pararhodobacter oceanensis TaxID=2172121 RepID=UPI003A919E2C
MSAPRPVPARTEVRRRWQDAGFVIPAFAALLLTPPFLNLFAVRRLLFGIPLEVAYLFTIWTALVLCAVVLSRRLPRQIDPEPVDATPIDKSAEPDKS